MSHTHMVEFSDRPGGYKFASEAPEDSRHTHSVKGPDGSMMQTGPPIGHGPSHAHMMPDGTLTSDPLDQETAFRTGWLPSIMSSSFGDWSDLGELGTGTWVAIGAGVVLIGALLYWSHQDWQSMSPEEREAERRARRQRQLIYAGGHAARMVLRP